MHEPVLERGVTIAVGAAPGSGGRGHGERAELSLKLRGVEARARGGEVQRGELEVSVLGPVRQHAQDVLGRSREMDRVCSPEMTRSARREAPRS